MTKEDYCSYEVANLLKEKGFDFENQSEGIKKLLSLEYNEVYFTITHALAMKWLREEHKLFIDISFQKDEDDSVTWFYMTWALDDRKRDAEEVDFTSYEEAVEAAIKYTLEKLI